MKKGFVFASMSLLLFSCSEIHGHPMPTVNGGYYEGISVEWKNTSDRAKISLKKNWSYFSFAIELVPHWESAKDVVKYNYDCGHFSYLDSTGDTVTFTKSLETPSYLFNGERMITVIFDTEFQAVLEAAEKVNFIVSGQTFLGPSNFLPNRS